MNWKPGDKALCVQLYADPCPHGFLKVGCVYGVDGVTDNAAGLFLRGYPNGASVWATLFQKAPSIQQFQDIAERASRGEPLVVTT